MSPPRKECDRNLRQQGVQKFAILNPGAGWGAKRWPEQRYGASHSELAKDGVSVLINCGPGEEDLARAVEEASAGTAKGTPVRSSQLIALTRRAPLFIGGDTGPMHLAAALGVPVVAIFGPTNPARNGPFATLCQKHRAAKRIEHHFARASRSNRKKDCWKSRLDHVVAAARQTARRSAVASWSTIARHIRVPLGFVFAALYFWLAKPTVTSMLLGLLLVVPGLMLRASGFRARPEK